MLSLVIFDLDDSLIHSNFDYATMKERVKSLFDDNILFSHNPTIKELLEILSKDQFKLEQAYSIINKMESESASKADLIPYADKLPLLINELKIKSAVLTNNSKESVSKYLKVNKFKFLHEMGQIITREDVSVMKPDPAGLNKIINSFGLNNKRGEVLFVGDSFIDADAAFQANIRFVLFNSRKLDIKSFKSPLWKVIDRLSDLPTILRSEMIDCVY